MLTCLLVIERDLIQLHHGLLLDSSALCLHHLGAVHESPRADGSHASCFSFKALNSDLDSLVQISLAGADG